MFNMPLEEVIYLLLFDKDTRKVLGDLRRKVANIFSRKIYEHLTEEDKKKLLTGIIYEFLSEQEEKELECEWTPVSEGIARALNNLIAAKKEGKLSAVMQ